MSAEFCSYCGSIYQKTNYCFLCGNFICAPCNIKLIVPTTQQYNTKSDKAWGFVCNRCKYEPKKKVPAPPCNDSSENDSDSWSSEDD